jgi:hypothetical protein
MLCASSSKTHLFWWFHSVQDPKIKRVDSLFCKTTCCLTCPFPPAIKGVLVHIWRSTCCSIVNQNCLEKTQATRRWSMDSSTWSQKGQLSGWGYQTMYVLLLTFRWWMDSSTWSQKGQLSGWGYQTMYVLLLTFKVPERWSAVCSFFWYITPYCWQSH